jgi:hypothetical protein
VLAVSGRWVPFGGTIHWYAADQSVVLPLPTRAVIVIAVTGHPETAAGNHGADTTIS